MSPTKRRVTAADVARSIGLSRATVGFVLNNTPGQTIPEKTRQRVLAEAERLGYRPNRAAQALRRGTSSNLILMIMPDWPVETMMGEFLDEVSLQLDRAGYSLVTSIRRPGDNVRPLWESLSPDVVIGLAEFGPDELESLRASGVSQILTTGLSDSEAATAGAREQVRYLHSRGHRRLAYAAPSDDRLADLVAARVAAAQDEAGKLGLDPLDVGPLAPGGGSTERRVRQWRDDGITAIVAYNDLVAATVVGAAMRAGIGVPAPLAVVGHDDTRLAEAFVPSLSSVRMAASALAGQIADLALHAAGHLDMAPDLVTPEFGVVRRESA
ncbi:LacI family DNA-binding transcriptional regulator [Nocardia neocaledoniensis]|uniref:LacI family DNA-binding transcriptional regulator n=1 Tax=Nocardia neocaledoniensis TaxID=236511 RepID=UPI002455872D|nr:LacI family DNA-binding transcriptional regulator [Nocardia neocaledoniensis]